MEYSADIVQRARAIAYQALREDLRSNGHPFIEHADGVARIVSDEIGLGVECLAAVYLHEATRFHRDVDISGFPEEILTMVKGLNNIATIRPKDTRLEAENYKKLIVQYSTDPRVTVLKIADRLEVMRNLYMFPKASRDQRILETLMLYIPLAHQLGLYNIKSEMEDIYFRFAEPEQYRSITRKLKATEKDRVRLMNEFIKPLEDDLSEAGIHYKLKMRTKTAYSIYRKMLKQDVPFEGVYDVFAIRFIIDCEADRKAEQDLCWKVYSYVTKEYEPDTKRLRDWVTNPKPNGYESLHITVKNAQGAYLEVQIRTRRMDDIAEKGIAAHWSYKKEGYISENDSEMDKWLAKVKEILVSPDVNALELLDIIHNDLTGSEIVVFTPKGEQRSVAKGSTALDFGYQIHTEIGNRAIAAKVNMKLVPLSYVLHSGDQVEIITAGNGHPKREWLQFLQTRHARNLVLDYFKGDKKETVRQGQALLAQYLEKAGYKMNQDSLTLICDHFNVPGRNFEELYFRIGLGMLNLGELPEVLSASGVGRGHSWTFPWFRRGKGGKDPEKNGSAPVIASCCKPIPGDPVIGIRTPDGVVTVHKKTCPVAENIASKHGDWVVVPKWEGTADNQVFTVRLSVTGIDRMGLLNEISRFISLVMGVNMRKVYLSSENGVFEGYFDLSVQNKSVLERMIKRLSAIDGIQNVARTDI